MVTGDVERRARPLRWAVPESAHADHRQFAIQSDRTTVLNSSADSNSSVTVTARWQLGRPNGQSSSACSQRKRRSVGCGRYRPISRFRASGPMPVLDMSMAERPAAASTAQAEPKPWWGAHGTALS